MGLTDNNNMVMPVSPYYGGNNGGGFGNMGSEGWWILLLLLFAGWGNGNNGFGGGGGGGNDLYPWLNQQQNTQEGFNQAATAASLAGIQTSLTNGFSNAEVSSCNRAMNEMQTEFTNQIASMNQNFANQQNLQAQLNGMSAQMAQCCCDNRAGLADLKYTVATEACADRSAVNDALRDVLAANTASTQRILDQLCQDKIDSKNEKIVELQNQLNMAALRESQVAQTAAIRAGQVQEVDALYNRLSTCPVPTMPVYGSQPIFTCPNNGCGCGCNG